MNSSTELGMDSAGTASNRNMDSMKVGLTTELMKEWRANAVVADAPFNRKKKLEGIIKRVKKEYAFNMPEYKIDEKFFQKVEDPIAVQRLLFNSLCNAKVVGEALKDIEMSFYEKDGYRSILLRSCYFDLFELILDSLRIPHDNHRHLILGSPGIGKSWFHIFCLYVLIKANVPVFIQRNEYSALFFKGEAYSCATLKENVLLTSTNVWHLYDRDEAPTGIGTGNIAVVVSVPNKVTYKQYAKKCHFGRMFMPLWSSAEVMKANLLRLPKSLILTEDTLNKRYKLCGGIARHIFDDFEDYLTQCVPSKFVYSKKELYLITKGEIENVDYLIFGLNVPRNYFRYEIIFLSKTGLGGQRNERELKD